MRTMLFVVLGSLVIAPVAWAGLSKKVDSGPISVEAKMIAADRSGQKEFPKLTGTNSDATSDFNVKGRIDFKDKDGNVTETCPYDITLNAKKTSSFDLRNCTYPVATSIDLLVDVIEQAQPLEPAPF